MFILYAVPGARMAPAFALVCALSFLNTLVIHNHVHLPMFRSAALNRAWNCVLSFGALCRWTRSTASTATRNPEPAALGGQLRARIEAAPRAAAA